jgi:hypothetical protein
VSPEQQKRESLSRALVGLLAEIEPMNERSDQLIGWISVLAGHISDEGEIDRQGMREALDGLVEQVKLATTARVIPLRRGGR